MTILRLLRRFVLMSAVEDGGGGGVATPDVVDSADDSAGSEQVVEQVSSTPGEAAKPATMLEAISQGLDAGEAGQPRDDKGRFAPKAGEQQPTVAATPATPAKPAVDPTKPAQPAVIKPEADDPLAMPDGLQPKAQQRFQKLVETNKELSTRAEQAEQQVSYIRETFQQHGVRREQFEQAASFIGAVNSGNLEQALQILDAQRREIAIALGKPLPGVDALSEHPDLRQRVDQLQMDEASAIELARSRRADAIARQNAESQQQQRQQAEQQQQAVQTGLQDIDGFCKQMQSTDLDYAVIEEQLLPEIQNLIRGVPPQAWKQTIETQYRLLKQAATRMRSTLAPSGGGTVLRPTGVASPAARPGSTYEAMWGHARGA